MYARLTQRLRIVFRIQWFIIMNSNITHPLQRNAWQLRQLLNSRAVPTRPHFHFCSSREASSRTNFILCPLTHFGSVCRVQNLCSIIPRIILSILIHMKTIILLSHTHSYMCDTHTSNYNLRQSLKKNNF